MNFGALVRGTARLPPFDSAAAAGVVLYIVDKVLEQPVPPNMKRREAILILSFYVTFH